MNPTALIAEDEPLLAMALRAELGRAWPELNIVGTVGDGLSAVKQALALKPDVLFFDIRMPGLDGLEAAAEVADGWNSGTPFPLLVFVTAYDQYAVRAFEVQAMDYVLKPVQADRLKKTVEKLQRSLLERGNIAIKPIANAVAASTTSSADAALAQAVSQLRHLLGTVHAPETLGSAAAATPLKVIQASVGGQIRMVPVDEVVYFEAADKYIRVLTEHNEYLIRTPLKELLQLLDAQTFWQIHRGTIVRASAIEHVVRDEAGKQHLALRGRPEKLAVSRLYAHLFKPM